MTEEGLLGIILAALAILSAFIWGRQKGAEEKDIERDHEELSDRARVLDEQRADEKERAQALESARARVKEAEDAKPDLVRTAADAAAWLLERYRSRNPPDQGG